MRRPLTYLVVDGVDLFGEFGLAVTDGFELSPPTPKTYTVDVPGMNGVLDLTESVSGDVSFSTREMSFELLWLGDGLRGFEEAKTRVSNFLHGRRRSFTWSRDPGYTYEGRFAIDGYASQMHHGTVRLLASCDPYKMAAPKRMACDAGGGAEFLLPSGRMPVVPVFDCPCETEVCGDGMEPVLLQRGRWRVRGLVLREGDNRVWVNSAVTERGDVPMSHWPDALSSYGEVRMARFCWTNERTDAAHRVAVEYEWGDL